MRSVSATKVTPNSVVLIHRKGELLLLALMEYGKEEIKDRVKGSIASILNIYSSLPPPRGR